MRLALAQYRELAAFSQFASDLDDATRKQLEHGRRVTELMKQKQFSPLSVSELAVSLFAADKGYLDGVAVEKVGAFEEGLLRLMHSDYADLMRQLEETGNYNRQL